MRQLYAIALAALAVGSATAAVADETVTPTAAPTAPGPEATSPDVAPRSRDASWSEVFGGPFPSSRIFAMPTADVVGAFQLSLSGDASLLTEARILSTSGVIAIGFGDIAQLEYRNTEALSDLQETDEALEELREETFGLSSLGVQLKLPYKDRAWLPAVAIALRFGLPRIETSADLAIEHEERATDFYVVSRLKVGPRLKLHGGLRVAAATIESTGMNAPADAKKYLFLPAGGIEYELMPKALVAAEVAQVPLFRPGTELKPSEIDAGIFGRLGIRWRLIPAVIIDASVGYRIEVARQQVTQSDALDAFVDWDIRIGGEIFIPWGAVVCRAAGAFCQ